MRADLEVMQVAQPLVQRCNNLNVQQIPRKLPSLHQHSTISDPNANCYHVR